MFPSCNFVSLVVIAIDLRYYPEQHSLDSRGGCPSMESVSAGVVLRGH